MQYISPFTLLDDITPQLVDRKSITLAKKKMLAELELNGGASIMVNGIEFTSNDIINFFDGLLQTDNISYHIAIAGNLVLQRFLEHNILENGDRFTNIPLLGNPAFINWVSPYYYTSFTSFAARCLQNLQDDGWGALLANPVLMTPADEERAWAHLEEIIYTQLETLAAFDRLENFSKDSINALVGFTNINILRQLPEARFAMLRDQYAWLVMQCAIQIFNRFNRGEGITIVGYAQSLAVSSHVREKIAEKQAEMENLQQKKDRKFSPMAGIGIAVFVLKLLLFNAGSCNSNNYTYNPNFTNAPVHYTLPGDTTHYRLLPDSLQEQIKQINAKSNNLRTQADTSLLLVPPVTPTTSKKDKARYDSLLKALK